MAINDGSANASIGSPQLPHLLDSYVTRPSWEVAGVDYAVGIPSGTVLKDPSTLNMSGVAVDTTNNLIRVTGNNVTLDGYNFTGWSVYITGGAQNTTVKDFIFLRRSRHICRSLDRERERSVQQIRWRRRHRLLKLHHPKRDRFENG